jgi:hypothetical protein
MAGWPETRELKKALELKLAPLGGVKVASQAKQSLAWLEVMKEFLVENPQSDDDDENSVANEDSEVEDDEEDLRGIGKGKQRLPVANEDSEEEDDEEDLRDKQPVGKKSVVSADKGKCLFLLAYCLV